jgi:hypothetical protein
LRKSFKVLILLTLLLGNGMGYAAAEEEEKKSDFTYYKEIEVLGQQQYKSFFLDEEVYEHTLSNLADLRILDEQQSTVPYYIQSGYQDRNESVVVYQSSRVFTAKEDNDTTVDFKVSPIQENVDIQGNVLSFSVPAKDFLKHVEVYGGFDGNEWQYIKKDYMYKADHLTKSTINLDRVYKYTHYRIVILDNAENIVIEDLKLIYNSIDTEWIRYQRTTELEYTIEMEDKYSLIELTNPQHLRIKEITLDTNENFQRTYTVYDEEERQVRADGLNEIYNLDFTDIKISNRSISFVERPLSSGIVTIKINNQDNPPLDIKGIKVEYYIDKIVFEDNGSASYKLYYGQSQAQKPQYEIERFKNHIEKEDQEEATLGENIAIQTEKSIEEKEPLIELKHVFNIIIVLISIFLIIFLIKRLNKK